MLVSKIFLIKPMISDTMFEERLPCNQCSKTYKNRRSLYYHVRFECGKPKMFACEQCDYRAHLKGNVRKHEIFIHNLHR